MNILLVLKIAAGLTVFSWAAFAIADMLVKVKSELLTNMWFVRLLIHLGQVVFFSWIIAVPTILWHSYEPVWQWYIGMGATVLDYLRALIWDNFWFYMNQGTIRTMLIWKPNMFNLVSSLFLIWFMMQ